MAILKRLSIFMAVFALLGVMGSTALTYETVGWYNSPGAGPALCNCQDLAHHTAETLVKAQLTGLLTGALFGLGLGLFMHQRHKHQMALLPSATSEKVPPAQPAAAESAPTEKQG